MLVKSGISHMYTEFTTLFHNRLSDSPFYRRKFPNGVHNFISLQQIPLTTKEELRSIGVMDLVAVDRSLISHYHESSGTTGIPSSSWFTRDDIIRNAQQINSTGLQLHSNDMVLIRFPYALFLPAFLIQEASYQKNAGIVHASSRNNVTTYPKILRLIKQLEISVFAGLPRELELLAETARLLDINIATEFPSLRAIWVAGELLSPKRKQHLERLWGVTVFSLYGMTETGNIAVMCNEGRLHYSEEEFHIEVLNEDKDTYQPHGKRGIAVISTLCHEASPLLRYENGDVISIHQSNCACGSTHRELRHYGRISERILHGDQVLDSYDIQEVIYGLEPVPVAWCVKDHSTYFELILEYSDEQQASQDLRKSITDSLGPNCQVTFLRENSLLNRSELLINESSRKPQYFMRLDQTSEHADFVTGKEFFFSGAYDKALQSFQKTIKEDAGHAEAHAFMAACLGKMIDQGNLISKMKHLPNLKRSAAKAVELNEFSALARGISGLVQLKVPEEFGGSVKKALKELKMSIYLGSQDPDIWIYLAEAYTKLNDLTAAKEALTQGLKIEPNHSQALDMLGNLEKKG